MKNSSRLQAFQGNNRKQAVWRANEYAIKVAENTALIVQLLTTK